MIKKLIYSLIKNRKITLFFVTALLIAGVFSYISSPKQESPDFSIPYAMITTVFPGASQSDVDANVTDPIVKALEKIDGYESSFAYSSNSMSLVIVEMEFSADREVVFGKLKETVLGLQDKLPEGCYGINVNTDITNTAGIMLSLSSGSFSNREVVQYAGVVEERLSGIDGFADFEIIGGLDSVISVKVDDEKMKSAGLTYTEISNLIGAGSFDIPIGKITDEGQKIIVDYDGKYKSIEDIINLEIGFVPELQRIIRLGDIASITEETASSNTYYTHNGEGAVILAGYFEDGINILPISNEITEQLDELKKELPAGIEISLIISQPEEVKDSLTDFSRNLIIAVLLVIMVVLIGMGFRNALVVSVSIPFSILISFSVMYLLGIKIHQVSIAALIVCLGMLVDNSIVVSDSIQGYIDEGMKRKKACRMGVRNVAVPVFASTITTIAAFMPFLFLNSIAGDYIKSLPQIVSISLAASYLTAILIIPVLGFILFKPSRKKKRSSGRKVFKRLLKGSMNRKILVIFIVLLLVAGSVFIALDLDKVFFPAADKNIIYIDIKNNDSDNLEGTIRLVGEISTVLDEDSGVIEYTSSAGGGLPRFNQIMFVYTKTPDTGQIMMRVDLDETDYKTNEEYKLALQGKLDEMNLAAKITVKELMYAFPMDEDLKIRIVGYDTDILKNYEAGIFELLSNTPGLINVNKGNTDYVDEFSLQIDKEEALKYGLMPAVIQNEISIALLGRVSAIAENSEGENKVIVSGAYSTEEDIARIPLRTARGEYISASEIINLEKTSTLSTIPRFNGDYAMTLTADYDMDYDKNEILENLKDEIEKMNLDDASVIYEGEDELIKENFGQVGLLGLIALIIVFLILMVQFKSFSMPLLIFITIPLSAVGSMAGLYITGQAISFTALLGIVSLLGIVVNNAIILIDRINKEKRKGVTVEKACVRASLRRVRPILLSTITTVIGLIPLAISASELFKPMAIALMSGLLVSTLLTLIVLPVLVSMTAKTT